MDYNKLWSLINKESLSKRAAARIAGMSQTGFNSMMERRTIPVDTLEIMAKHFNVPMSYFFEEDREDGITIASDVDPNYSTCRKCRDKDVEIQLLNKQLNSKDDKNDKLIKEVGALEHQLKGANGNSEKKAS